MRLPTASKGHTLVLNLYDIGDANDGVTGTLQVIPPPDSNVGATFGNTCRWTGDSVNGAIAYAANTQTPPWGPLDSSHTITACKITNVNDVHAHWNAQWSTVQIPIPANYSCNDGSPQGCWVTINYLFNGVVHDVTSWNAFLLGDPVRLTQ